jgi:hypothetical protein
MAWMKRLLQPLVNLGTIANQLRRGSAAEQAVIRSTRGMSPIRKLYLMGNEGYGPWGRDWKDEETSYVQVTQ